ncbi:MAG: DUF937 domain-containing protein [Rhabdaerophilum sp.]
MLNLLEIMQQAQGGNAYNNLANQFGIGPDQAKSAVEALLPAFSMGLQQQTQSAEGWQNLLGSLGQAQGAAQFFDSDGDGIPDHLDNDSQNALGAMFGNEQTTQAVAAQAAQFAGLPAGMMQQMLPVIASMVMGGLFKGAMNNGLGGLLGQMMQGGGAGGMPGGLGSILGGMLGGQQMAPQSQPQMGGMGGMLGNILGSFFGGRAPEAPPPPQDPMAAGLDMLKGMFQTGQEVQNTQVDALQQIFKQITQR